MLDPKDLNELTALFGAERVSQAPDDLLTYGRDWTKFHDSNPSAIVFPRTTEEVSRFLRYCSQRGLPVVPSGGRTGLAGGAVASRGELVLSTERMRKMHPVDGLARTVRVQAGAVTEAVHQHCAPHGLTWPVDFASKGSSQVGGNIATNAGGIRVIRYGLTRQWVLGLEVCLMDGTVLELNGALEKNNTGLDLRQLFIGTEGTVGVVTEATLKLTRIPNHTRVLFLATEGLKGALALFRAARAQDAFEILAFEYLTEICLRAVQEGQKKRHPLSTPASAYVLLEVELVDPSQSAKLEGWIESLFEAGLVADGVLAQSLDDARELWSLREGIGESLYRRGLLHKNDIALPISSLEPFATEMEAMFKRSYPDLELFVFGHIGDGNLHINTLKPGSADKAAFIERCAAVDTALFTLVRKHRGSVSAEHGIGLLKKSALAYSRTSEELVVLRRIKQALDPKNLLNPGKIFDL